MTALAAAADPPLSLDLPGSRSLTFSERPLLMRVLNLTPDSFSDGGRYTEPGAAVERAMRMLEEGADIIDLGAESTRPGGGVYGDGADPVSAAQEIERLRPVLEILRPLTEAVLSVDTRKAAVAAVALDCGADLINDVSALNDPEMAPLVAARGVPIVLMHGRGEIRSMQRDIHFENVVLDVRNELEAAAAIAQESGISASQILVDPGIGFGKTVEHNLELLRGLGVLARLGHAIVVGASRKSFIGAVDGRSTPGLEHNRLGGSLAAAAWAATAGAHIVRIHDVPETAQFFRLWATLQAQSGAGP